MDNGQTHSNYSPVMWFLGEQITGHACYVRLYQPAHEVRLLYTVDRDSSSCAFPFHISFTALSKLPKV